jgi:hypothetical protein
MQREPKRSVKQKRANELDLALFRVLSRAAGYACKDQTHSHSDRNEWARIEDGLRSVRPKVRAMMHPDDRAETQPYMPSKGTER